VASHSYSYEECRSKLYVKNGIFCYNKGMFKVYILQSMNFPNKLYKGFTRLDINERLAYHNRGKVSFYTWVLAFLWLWPLFLPVPCFRCVQRVKGRDWALAHTSGLCSSA